MNGKFQQFQSMYQAVIKRVDEGILNHQNGIADDLSSTMLLKVREELIKMKECLDINIFEPSYARYVSDWSDERGLIRLLCDLDYCYSRLKRH